MAVYCWPYKDEQAVEVTDLKTGRKERFPVTVFNKDWTHRFGQAVFRPDGKAIVVSLSHTKQVIRAGDDWVQHFGVIWLDGRRERTSVFKVEAPLFKGKFQFCIDRIEWSRGPGPADEPATPPGRAP
jgi:hypothetical protein